MAWCCDFVLRWRNLVLKIVLKKIKHEKWNIDKTIVLMWCLFWQFLYICVIVSFIFHYKVWTSFHHLPSRPVKRAWMRMSFRRQKEFWRLRHSWVGWFNHQGCDGWNFWSLKKTTFSKPPLFIGFLKMNVWKMKASLLAVNYPKGMSIKMALFWCRTFQLRPGGFFPKAIISLVVPSHQLIVFLTRICTTLCCQLMLKWKKVKRVDSPVDEVCNLSLSTQQKPSFIQELIQTSKFKSHSFTTMDYSQEW